MEISVMQDILGKNDQLAAKIRTELAAKGVFVINMMGSPGAGKTTLLEKTLGVLAKEFKLAVIEGDLFTSKDADRIEKTGVPVLQINTSGGCHLDAQQVSKAIRQLIAAEPDCIIIENVGNLVCPAEFDIGEDVKVTVLSVTEGDDKPLKYPLIFKESAVVLLNKTDILPFTNFDIEAAKDDIMKLNPAGKIMPVSCVKGDGIDVWCEWLREEIGRKRSEK